jgi:hypothetical protein
MGRVRVVGLEVCVFVVLAGAGPHRRHSNREEEPEPREWGEKTNVKFNRKPNGVHRPKRIVGEVWTGHWAWSLSDASGSFDEPGGWSGAWVTGWAGVACQRRAGAA